MYVIMRGGIKNRYLREVEIERYVLWLD